MTINVLDGLVPISTYVRFTATLRAVIDPFLVVPIVLALTGGRSAAKRDHAAARYNYILDTLRLKQAAATLAPADLDEVNGWLVK